VSQHSSLTNRLSHRLSEADLLADLARSEPGSGNLNNEMLDASIARILARWQQINDRKPSAAPHVFDTPKAAKMIYGGRRKIDHVFGVNGFSVSPAWDIMLDLYVARSSNKAVSTSSACIGAACPSTTGLRWLRILEQRGLLTKADDATDGRRSFYSLTEVGVSLTEAAIQASFPSP